MKIQNLRLRVKIPILIGLLSFILFLLHFLITEFAFKHFQNPAGKNPMSLKMIGLYLSFAFTGILSGFTYFVLGYIYQIFNRAAAEIQDLENESLGDDGSEESDFLRKLKLSLFQAQNSTSFQVEATKGQWEESRSLLINKLMPDMNLHKIQGWDVAIFPSMIRSANCDYIHIIQTSDGFVGVLAGFVETGITESAQKLFIHGLFSAFKESDKSTKDLMENIESSLHALTLTGLKLSLFGLGEERDKLQFLHFMDMPIFQFSSHGIQVIEGSGDDSWHALHPHEFSIADGIEVGDYLVWGTDRALKEFSLTSFEIMEEFVDYLLDLSPKSSREMLLAIAKKLSMMGKEKHLINPLDNLSIIVVKRTK
ncbi:MAG: Arg-Lys translocation region protein phosphatase [Leptospira sp.]|nr:Arg-Lys translocation region protein phosphatase [Leptospira sp.]